MTINENTNMCGYLILLILKLVSIIHSNRKLVQNQIKRGIMHYFFAFARAVNKQMEVLGSNFLLFSAETAG